MGERLVGFRGESEVPVAVAVSKSVEHNGPLIPDNWCVGCHPGVGIIPVEIQGNPRNFSLEHLDRNLGIFLAHRIVDHNKSLFVQMGQPIFMVSDVKRLWAKARNLALRCSLRHGILLWVF